MATYYLCPDCQGVGEAPSGDDCNRCKGGGYLFPEFGDDMTGAIEVEAL